MFFGFFRYLIGVFLGMIFIFVVTFLVVLRGIGCGFFYFRGKIRFLSLRVLEFFVFFVGFRFYRFEWV